MPWFAYFGLLVLTVTCYFTAKWMNDALGGNNGTKISMGLAGLGFWLAVSEWAAAHQFIVVGLFFGVAIVMFFSALWLKRWNYFRLVSAIDRSALFSTAFRPHIGRFPWPGLVNSLMEIVGKDRSLNTGEVSKDIAAVWPQVARNSAFYEQVFDQLGELLIEAERGPQQDALQLLSFDDDLIEVLLMGLPVPIAEKEARVIMDAVHRETFKLPNELLVVAAIREIRIGDAKEVGESIERVASALTHVQHLKSSSTKTLGETALRRLEALR